MKTCNTEKQQITRRLRRIACVTALGLTSIVALPQAARPDTITPPAVPGNLVVDAPHVPFLQADAFGTQNYVCVTSGAGVAFVLFTPQATLFNDDLEEVITHFFSPDQDPKDLGNIRVAWQHSRDTSTFWGSVKAFSFDANFVTPVDPLAPGRAEGNRGRTCRRRQADENHLRAPREHGGRSRARDGLQLVRGHRQEGMVPYKADYIFYKDPTPPQQVRE